MGGAFGEMMMAAIGGVICFVVIKEIMGGQNTVLWYRERPQCQATDIDKETNSVNPKTLSHGNTEPSVKACVETMSFPSHVDDDIVRTCVKAQELSRNEVVAQKMCGNSLQHWKSPSSRPSFLYLRLSALSLRSLQFSNA